MSIPEPDDQDREMVVDAIEALERGASAGIVVDAIEGYVRRRMAEDPDYGS